MIEAGEKRFGKPGPWLSWAGMRSSLVGCAYLSIALLAGLLLNALAGWWWADPTAALVIAGFALHEGRESRRGTACDCC